MSDRLTPPTPYPDVNAVLNALLSDVQTILGDHFVGLYLYGSLASGDFNLDTSDIDFLVVTADELPDELLPALRAMHTRLLASDMKWAKKLEGTYIPQRAIRRYDPQDAQRPGINEGNFYLARQGSDWVIQRHIIREMGVVVAGPAPQTLIDPVPVGDVQQAVRAVLREWWSPMLDKPDWLHRSDYQAFAILSMCRALHTLQHGTVLSKPAAARWAQTALGEPWAALIELALDWRHDWQLDKLSETLAFIRYTLERSQQSGTPYEI